MSQVFVARVRLPGTAPSIALASLALASLSFSRPAHAKAGQIYGGGGGHYFEYMCPPGQLLTGLRGSAGVLIDAIQPICSRLDARNLTIGENLGPVFGSDRKMDTWAACSGPYAITDAFMARNEKDPYLGAIRLICNELVVMVFHVDTK